MRIRVKLVLAITGMVSAIVVVLSSLYLAQLLSERIQQSYQHTDIATHQLLLAVQAALERGLNKVSLPANDPNALDDAMGRVLHQDPALQLMLTSLIRYEPTIYDINIANSKRKILLS